MGGATLIVDTSAILAIFFAEPDAELFDDAIIDAADPSMSVASWIEAFLVVQGRGGQAATLRLERLLQRLSIRLEPVRPEHANIARIAAARYGKGMHPAALNLGDLFSYALAMETGRPLLFKGNDFSRTDVRRALPG